ncbi:hypothetical protein GZ77_03945 [Endozoicomonas montiporae]|uniref:Uncharacterized protein n=2 Tax=Endozoicomonas montiporae TaxID=1027273 RepID=A0A081NB98_9GAMM|nr:hypothetical protein [Endozoicomonas montiporae]AMO55997.1 hypothetical protein EZMO1_1854 [Endozoicomonas montiporae CL-33]AMO56547.1 hypothetical protein EZMO1_2463 [Endozoicomonas montiporae CL-33]KEQ14198.1 hypothetical protein GZ77_07135 [Endozoicomonas montiporae]KEQ15721.1 hypothetical protein GZ77_03945 [Endozoicomonas montiporae]
MKIIKQLLVNGEEVGLISDETRLELSSPGRARFLVQSDKPLTGVVQFSVGWSGMELYRLFVGYIDKPPTTVNAKQQLLFCRELSAALNRPLPMGLRHVSLKDVLAKISQQTELVFVTSSASYTRKQASHFHHIGGGYMAMDAIGQVFNIPQYIWQQQGDGSIYVGSWSGSRWASRPVQIPDKFFTEHLAFNSARMMMAPSLRPGVQFNRGIINCLTCSNDSMVITWTPLKEL